MHSPSAGRPGQASRAIASFTITACSPAPDARKSSPRSNRMPVASKYPGEIAVHVGLNPRRDESVSVKKVNQLMLYIGGAPDSATCLTPGTAAIREARTESRAGNVESLDRDRSS